ncbi:MAG TPA: glycosyltransferase family 4 protein, partial [Metabacillus sp.]|nr:glycosyltransferase family 4 protein [Metabacillus sp.]
IPNGIIIDDFSKILSGDDALKRFPFIKTPFLLGMGRLVKEKGFHFLIEAFLKIHGDHPTLKLVIAGIGPFENQLKQLIELYGLESKVIFVGFLKEIERNTLLSMCEILVVPSLYEPFGIVALEGMAFGKPVLAFKTGGLIEILQDLDGMIVDQVSNSNLAEKLHYCLQHPKEMKKIAEQGYQAVIDNYQWFSIIKKTIAVYNKMVCK